MITKWPSRVLYLHGEKGGWEGVTNEIGESTHNFSLIQYSPEKLKGTLMQILKSANIFVFIWKQYVEDFTLKHFLLFEIFAPEICEKFVYKHSEAINVKN